MKGGQGGSQTNLRVFRKRNDSSVRDVWLEKEKKIKKIALLLRDGDFERRPPLWALQRDSNHWGVACHIRFPSSGKTERTSVAGKASGGGEKQKTVGCPAQTARKNANVLSKMGKRELSAPPGRGGTKNYTLLKKPAAARKKSVHKKRKKGGSEGSAGGTKSTVNLRTFDHRRPIKKKPIAGSGETKQERKKNRTRQVSAQTFQADPKKKPNQEPGRKKVIEANHDWLRSFK